MKNSIIYSIANIDKAVSEISNLFLRYSIFTFTGDLGTGKTTLIKNILINNGITDLITSPTFNIVNIYNHKFYHFDLYRIKTDQEFFSNGFHEILFQTGIIIFIEWPEIILRSKDFANLKICKINIEYLSETERVLTYILD